MRTIFRILLAFSLMAIAAIADVVTARVTFTNATNLKNAAWTNGATITVNSDTRTWTNSVSSAATQIPLTSVNGTNIAQQVQLFLSHARGYSFTGLTPSSDLLTYVDLRGTNGQAMSVSISPSTYAAITYSTNTVGTGYVVRLPITVETPANRTNIANMLIDTLALSPSATFMSMTRPGFYTSVSQSARYTLGPTLESGDVVFQAAQGPGTEYNRLWKLVDSTYATNAAGWVSLGTKWFSIYHGGTVTPTSGTFTGTDGSSFAMGSILILPGTNAFTGISISATNSLDGTFTLDAFGPTLTSIQVSGNTLTTFDVSALTVLTNLMATNTALNSASVNNTLTNLAYFGLSNGVVNLSGGTSATTNAAGSAAVQTLVSRGWTVGNN